MSLAIIPATKQLSENTSQWAIPEMLSALASEGESDLVLELIGTFRDDTGRRFRDAREAAARGDREVLTAQAHSIKGSSSQMGATALAAICARVEFAAPKASLSQLISDIDAAEAEFTNVCRAMASYSPQQIPC